MSSFLGVYGLTARFPAARQARQGAIHESGGGSLEKCHYYLILASDLGYGDASPLTPRLEEVSKLLNAYTAAIRADF